MTFWWSLFFTEIFTVNVLFKFTNFKLDNLLFLAVARPHEIWGCEPPLAHGHQWAVCKTAEKIWGGGGVQPRPGLSQGPWIKPS